MYANLELFIDGKWLGGNGRRGEDVINPATERAIAELDQAGVEETDEAVARAKAAFPGWRAVAPADRARPFAACEPSGS